MPKKQKPFKILILGLDNSGKSSILLSLKENTNIMSFYSLKPTKGVKIESFETEELAMSCWDFGGQEQYRKKHLNKFSEYTDKSDKLIFVIDVQNYNEYDTALDYLKTIIDLLKNEKNYIDISIFLHKFDPNLTKIMNFKDIEKIVNDKLINRIVEIIPPNFKFDVFKTTIYTVFEKFSVQLE